jgi:hypothetical protein
MWSSFEQYEASTRNSWHGDICLSGSATCLCCTGVGATAISAACSDCKGFFVCCGPSTNKWFVADTVAEISRTWYSRADGVTQANSCLGSCGWFIPTPGQLRRAGFFCKSYWDFKNNYYWSNCEGDSIRAPNIEMVNGCYGGNHQSRKDRVYCVRAFRCTIS